MTVEELVKMRAVAALQAVEAYQQYVLAKRTLSEIDRLLTATGLLALMENNNAGY